MHVKETWRIFIVFKILTIDMLQYICKDFQNFEGFMYKDGFSRIKKFGRLFILLGQILMLN